MLRLFKIKLIPVILISFLGIIVYSNTFFCPFHYDDRLYILDNFGIKGNQDLLHIWNFYPCRFVGLLSFLLNYHFNGLDVFGYHLFNVAVHLISAILVWWLVLLTFSTPVMKMDKFAVHADLVALCAGLIFVAHPLQTETVTYIWQRVASLAAMFYLASLCLYIKFRLADDHKSGFGIDKIYYGGAWLCAILAMFTKEMSVTLPFMIILYESFFFSPKIELQIRRIIPFFIILFVISITIISFPSAIRNQEMEGVLTGARLVSPIHYFLTQGWVMVSYLRLIFLPFNQNLDYDFLVLKSFFDIPVFCGFLLIAAILFMAKRLFLKHRLVSFSIIWFFIALLPESSLIPLQDLISEHRLYLPMAGFSLFLASGAFYIGEKKGVKFMLLALLLIITCYSVLTFQRNKIWKDDLTLWNDTVSKSPFKARPYINRGMDHLIQGQYAQAIIEFNKAIELNPGYSQAFYNRGLVYDDQGNTALALSDYSKAIEITPDYTSALEDRGLIYIGQGDYGKAISDLNKAIEIKPDLAELYNDRGCIYFKQGEFLQALSDHNKAIGLDPGDLQAYQNRLEDYKALVQKVQK